MVSEKPWKTEAVLRLGLSLFICQFFGMLVLTVGSFFAHRRAESLWLFFGLLAASALSCGVALYVLRKPWDLDRFTRQFICLIVALYLGLMFGAFATRMAGPGIAEPTTGRAVVVTLSFQGMALILVHRFLKEHSITWAAGFGFPQRPALSPLLGMVGAVVFLPVGLGLRETVAALMSYFNRHPEAQAAVEALKNSTSPFDRVTFALVAIGLAPIAEEILFRGILYPTIKGLGFPKLALWGTSLLFALIHFNLPSFLPLLLFALVLTWLYEKTGNLLASITAHLTFNALNFVLFLTDPWLWEKLRRLWPFGSHA